ncbi:hypothetical protein PPTG_20696 [Phytophthora nicotianae INRA-310]|uniref:Uncharacterized protein n=1 Tax=Phytophthora nicotianae (strain INRA-310) TaxID=761204 RepID=W2REB3_PHYN3|nr:hypothetical protein PPTG_20696 [Phytophthora nicotianae INRA-310]ETN23727.1 hypothetical protein PPTG_20696 [Phytophthora nicotianae INRA-310]
MDTERLDTQTTTTFYLDMQTTITFYLDMQTTITFYLDMQTTITFYVDMQRCRARARRASATTITFYLDMQTSTTFYRDRHCFIGIRRQRAELVRGKLKGFGPLLRMAWCVAVRFNG